MTRLEERLGGALCAWVEWVRRHHRAVIAAVLVASACAAAWAATHLGINADNKDLLARNVPFRKAWESFSRRFPTLDDALLVVVDAQTPELARDSAQALARRLAANSEAFHDAYVPGSGEFFERNGLLYRSVDDLDTLSVELARVQPVLAELARDPSVANLTRVIRFGLERTHDGEGREEDWPAILDRVSRATVEAYEEHPVSVSWEEILLRGSALDPTRRQVIVAEPVLAFHRLLAAEKPLRAIHRAADELGLTPDKGVRVRVTGNPALSYEEMEGLLWDVGYASLISAVVICGLLYFALRSVRLVAAALITLVCGLVCTAAFAALTVERLNLVSVAFAVLFVGLGIDFAIHLGLHYEDLRRRGEPHGDALLDGVRTVGASLVVCTLTTAIGFYAFAPTEFRGVAELGLISGTGMFVILALTLTLFPALMEAWLRDKSDWPARGGPMRLARLATAELHPHATCAVAAIVGVAAIALLPRLRFDSNVVKMRNPNTESVQTFRDLLAKSRTSPWQIDLLAPDLQAAQALAARVRRLDAVDRAVTLADYVPANQEEKVEILGDLALLLDFPDAPPGPHPPLSVAQQIAALSRLRDLLASPWLARASSPLALSANRLRTELDRFLQRVDRDDDPDKALANLQTVLLGGLPEQLARIREATRARPFGLKDLPRRLRQRMLAADGTARVQVFPRENLNSSQALARFVDEVQGVSPQVTGLAANIVEFSRATANSLREALVISLLAVAGLLFLLWRRVAETALALAPLLLGAVATGATMVLSGTAFNFANVIVLPLLMGMGVDSGIHLVHRGVHLARSGEGGVGLAGTVAARGVFYSALTTVVSFGSLGLSDHRGLASLGDLLVVAMVLTLACNLLVLPALIRLYRARLAPESSSSTSTPSG